MEILRKWLAICLLLLSGNFITFNKATAQPAVSVSFQTFYNELRPYGRWVDNQRYGQVWIPQVESNFQPYGTKGHWIVTDYGNTWVSDYSWGWAPFHYGRWVQDEYYGWIWVPGNEWSPAWVAWRSGGDYYGWAPLGPGLNVNVSVNIPLLSWIFAPARYITSPRIYDYYIPRRNVVNIYSHTTIINNYYDRSNNRYVYGPRPHDIERYTNRPVVVHRINNSDRPGRSEVRNGYVNIYRPNVDNNRRDFDRNVANNKPQSYPSRYNGYNNDRNDGNTRMERSNPSRNNGYNNNNNNNDRNERNTQMERPSPSRNNEWNTDRKDRDQAPNQPSRDRGNNNSNERYLAERESRISQNQNREMRSNYPERRSENQPREQSAPRQNQEVRQREQRSMGRSENRQNESSGSRPERGGGRSRPSR